MSAHELAERAPRHGGPDAFALVTRERSLMLRFAAGRPTQSTEVDDVTIEIAVQLRGPCRPGGDERGRRRRRSRPAPSGPRLAAACRRGRRRRYASRASRPSTSRRPATPSTPRRPTSTRRWAGRAGGGVRDRREPASRRTAPGPSPSRTQAWATRRGQPRRAAHRRLHEGDLHRPERPQRLRVGDRGMRGAIRGARAGRARRARRRVAAGRAGRARAGRLPGGVRAPGGRLAADLLAGCAFNGLAHAEGRGALAGRLGEPVAAPAINLSDSPVSPRTLPRAFDAEGVAQGAAAADPGRRGARRGARRPQRGAGRARTRPATPSRRAATLRAPTRRTWSWPAAARTTRPSSARPSSAAST